MSERTQLVNMFVVGESRISESDRDLSTPYTIRGRNPVPSVKSLRTVCDPDKPGRRFLNRSDSGT